MKKSLLLFSLLLTGVIYGNPAAKSDLSNIYDLYRTTPSDINQHIPVLRQLAKECSSAAEIGTRNIGSTWGIVMGLSESAAPKRSFLEIEYYSPPLEKLYLTKRLANENNISYRYLQKTDVEVDLEEPVDLLFIDGLHTYCHLTYQLDKFSPKVLKYIAMHDTSPPWGYADDTEYHGDYAEYPASINREKRGLSPAIDDFLARNSEWTLYERRFNNHGFTILKRKS